MMDRDRAYGIFTEGQKTHDCPGYDCSVCHDVFENLFVRLNAAEQVGEETVFESLMESLYPEASTIGDRERREIMKAAHAIVSKFSLPDKERMKEIIKEVLREFLPHRNSEDKYLNDLANALASALTKGEK